MPSSSTRTGAPPSEVTASTNDRGGFVVDQRAWRCHPAAATRRWMFRRELGATSLYFFFSSAFEILRIERRAPLRLDGIDLRATALRHVYHARAEDAVHADQQGVVGSIRLTKQVSMPALPYGHRQRQAILGLEHLHSAGHALIHDLKELWIQVADHGKRHAWSTRGWTGLRNQVRVMQDGDWL